MSDWLIESRYFRVAHVTIVLMQQRVDSYVSLIFIVTRSFLLTSRNSFCLLEGLDLAYVTTTRCFSGN